MKQTIKRTYHCGCGAWTGERCNWQGAAAGMVVVEWMPKSIRASHFAAGNCGRWPLNGAVRVAVEKSCADLLIDGDADEGPDEWGQVVKGANPAEYAEQV